MDANHVTHVSYVGINRRETPVHGRVIHIPRVGEHIRWMRWEQKQLGFHFSYCEVAQVTCFCRATTWGGHLSQVPPP